jgi:hypothetical protein
MSGSTEWSDLTEAQREPFRQAALELLQGKLVCGRVDEAWDLGTMSREDFRRASEVPEIVEESAQMLYSGLDFLLEAMTRLVDGIPPMLVKFAAELEAASFRVSTYDHVGLSRKIHDDDIIVVYGENPALWVVKMDPAKPSGWSVQVIERVNDGGGIELGDLVLDLRHPVFDRESVAKIIPGDAFRRHPISFWRQLQAVREHAGCVGKD